MSYQRNITFDFGSLAGLSLNARLLDASGAQVGSTISSGFVDLGNGSYSLLATIPSGHVGSLIASKVGDASIDAIVSINPSDEAARQSFPTSIGSSRAGLFVTAFKNRTSRERITILNADGTAAAFAINDKVRVKIGKSGQTPILDIVSGTNLAGGSYVTKANPCILELVQGDLSTIPPGIYDVEACVVDSVDHSRIKCAEQGIFVLHNSQAGGVT